jgi:flavin-dependent dehydrogenase
MRIWARIKSTYPGFSDFLKDATVDYEELTYLPNAKMANLFIPKPGAVLLGDSAGFINPFGSSGLYYAMKMAALWVNYIIKKLKSDTEDTQFNRKLWNEENIKHFNSKFKSTEIFQQVSNMYNLIGAFEYKIFNRLRVSEKINKKWDYITSLLKQA